MKKCLFCQKGFSVQEDLCPNCQQQPARQAGFVAYAPEFAQQNSGFKNTHFAELMELEKHYFWFRARNRLIIWALEKYCAGLSSFFEIGCGTGYVLTGIAHAFPQLKLSGSEIFIAGLEFAANRLPYAQLIQMDARNIPFVNEFDVIGSFDVLEHIQEDEQVLSQIYAALKPNGMMLLTVPQHGWLWSHADEYACHVRRYTAKELHAKIQTAGFKILKSTSFVTSLLPAMLVSRLLKKITRKNNIDPLAEFKLPGWLNRLFENMLNAELMLIRNNINLPIGGSRLIVARKII